MLSSAKILNSILILYLIDKMDLPLTKKQIESFALKHMDFFALQESLQNLLNISYIESHNNNSTTKYTLTEEGFQSLEYFQENLGIDLKNEIQQYVLENRKTIKRDYETTANYFKTLNSEDFTVKCALYEDSTMLMEINLSVVSKEQAKLICTNWKKNITKLYGAILDNLIE